MKNVRIMLAAIALFAVAGGAMAFKAQKFGATQIRYGFASNSCPTLTNVTFDVASGVDVFYTTPQGNTAECLPVTVSFE